MPRVVPLPPGGLSTEIGTIADDIRTLEADRSGAAYIFSNASGSTGAGAWVQLAGFPLLTLDIAAAGGVLLFAGCTVVYNGSNGLLAQVGIFVDGATPTIGIAPTIVTPLPPVGTQFSAYIQLPLIGLSMGYHSFAVGVFAGATTVCQNPWIAGYPI
jgi:hypothetical protein